MGEQTVGQSDVTTPGLEFGTNHKSPTTNHLF
jgi:hypothetical protein